MFNQSLKNLTWQVSIALLAFGCVVREHKSFILGLAAVLIIAWHFVFKEKFALKEAWQEPLIKGTCLCFGILLGTFFVSSFMVGTVQGLIKCLNYVERLLPCVILLFIGYRHKDIFVPSFIGILLGFTYVNGYIGYEYLMLHKFGGYYGNHNIYGTMMVIALPCLFLWSYELDGKLRYLGFVVASITLFLLVIGGSRAAAISVLAMLLIYLWLNRHNKRILKVGLLLLGICVLGLGFVYGYGQHTSIRGGDMERVIMWKGSLQMIFEHPFFGIGDGNWNYMYQTYYMVASTSEYTAPASHNIWIDMLARLGLVGTMGYVVLLVYQWKALYKRLFNNENINSYIAAMVLPFIGVQVYNLVDYTIRNRHCMILYGFIWAITVYKILEEEHKHE